MDELIRAYAVPSEQRTESDWDLLRAYRAQFSAGRRFRVLQPCNLWGMQSTGPYAKVGWGLRLQPGTVLTCAGQSMTSGDGVPATKWQDADGAHLAIDCVFVEVVGGMWGGQLPQPGLVELVV